ncbi:SRPBCC family protein [Allokutzneria albata]|uniref:Polyketide cyclase / dehydrase and lipid transport n=1 Tax=Allokutzneria albata TaxID=211114 RepID=A0A1G9UST2_ALLAB|nr:SRPBCC family protein [Allokutzneria albata]SDM62857.1 Polyketide cyclase / dehydrase and lipid transport [Allokutzneria albata]
MSVIEEQVEVHVPVRTAYDQWTQFESFPQFMEGVERVEQRTNTLTHWHTSIAGVDREFDAEILHQVPDERVSWSVLSGPKHRGTVSFTPEDATHTKVSLRIEYEPEGVVENVGDKLGIVRGRVKGDLKRFKEFIEERGTETGAWRGEVKPGDSRL